MNYKEQLKYDEGYRDKVYKCPSGYLTVGYGRNLETRGITQDEANILFENDIKNCWKELEVYPWFTRSPLPIQECLINMCYNMGLPKLLGFKRMIEALLDKNYCRASNEALDSRWARQVGDRAHRIADIIRSHA